MKDRDRIFHETWLGLAQPVEGLVFSVPVLADAQIAPDVRPALSTAFSAHVDAPEGEPPRVRSLERLFRDFLGYGQRGMLVGQADLPVELSFYAAEGGQEIRPSFAIGRGPFASDDPFAVFEEPKRPTPDPARGDAMGDRFTAVLWDLTQATQELGPEAALDFDAPEAVTGPWRYPPTAKLERLLRHVGIPVGFLFNGRALRLVYAPTGETSAHLTFRVEHLIRPEGRPLVAALDLLLHARRAYSADATHTLEGLLAASRRRQADVTEELAKQVFEAVEILVAGFEAAGARDAVGARPDWLRAALEEEGDHFYQGVLSVVLRVVFLLYSEDQALLPVEHPTFAEHLSLVALHERLAADSAAHPESMHHRFGAYGQLLSLFRAVFYGVKHGTLRLPPRRGRLFDPNAYPFLEGGEPGWTAAVLDPESRAAALPPSIDDGTVHRVLHRLVVFEGQRLSYRTLDVEQIGSVYESLMGNEVVRLGGDAVRVGKYGVWVEADELRQKTPTDRARFLKEACGLNPGPVQAIEKAFKEATAGKEGHTTRVDALAAQATGKKADILKHRAGAGRLVLQPGEERRRTGSHYTPRVLTEKVVARTLEPLLVCLGEERTPEQILQLKVCDPAMGSGAFLVATCRALASEIVAAWTRRGELAATIEKHGDAHLHARRLVAQQCLYGVDKNPAAVELAKLSLWLVTLSRELPFTFVDHALRHGDSLVGLDFAQIGAFHWAPPKQHEMCRLVLKDALEQAVTLRQEILALADHEDAASQAEKRRLFEFSQQAIDRVRLIADVCVGAFFAEAKDAAREKERKRRLALVETWIAKEQQAVDEGRSEAQREKAGQDAADARAELEALQAVARKELSPFHWWIEFPEVFFEERPDPLDGGKKNGAALMEAVVGNPPFGGKNTLAHGTPRGYVDWLKAIHAGAHGNSDLSAHFFRRAAALVGEHGVLGLIATNTIAQGDTRATGLQALVLRGWEVFDATDSMPWPGAASVTVSVVMLSRGTVAGRVQRRLGGHHVDALNSGLRPKPERAQPEPLASNENLLSQGSIVVGLGFTLAPDERDALIAKDSRNAERIFRYTGGDEVNSSAKQTAERYIIGFGRMSLEEAARWPDLIRIVRERVKPERELQRDNTIGNWMRAHWWRYWADRTELYAALRQLERCVVRSLTSKHHIFTFRSASDVIFDQTLIVLPSATATAFGVLSSAAHRAWVAVHGATLEDRQRYNIGSCFENFAFPRPDPRTVIPELETIGEQLYAARAAFMVETEQGLTRTYNALKDPACEDPRIVALRRLHEDLDRAVLAAYGWSDIAVPPFCPATDADRAALQAFEDEVIDRLYVLNAERAREEERLGLRANGGAKGKGKAKTLSASTVSDEGPTDSSDGGGPVDDDADAARPSDSNPIPETAKRGARAKKAPSAATARPGKDRPGKGQGDLF